MEDVSGSKPKRRATVPPSYSVEIAPHGVAPRWIVPAGSMEVPASSTLDARTFAVRITHSRLKIPPMRPLVRQSLRHTWAERVEVADEPQGQLFRVEQVAA
jgi:hypothetical protein